MPKKRNVKFPYGLPLEEAFELRVVRSVEPTDCWGWIGSFSGKGYAQMPGGTACRWSLERKIQRRLETGEQCRHLCGNPACTNPLHLDVGTQSQNERDKQLHHSGRLGSNGFHKLTMEDAIKIRSLAGTMLQREIAKQYNITQVMVSRIITGKAWNEHYSTQRAIQD
jgi:hypothetical protein